MTTQREAKKHIHSRGSTALVKVDPWEKKMASAIIGKNRGLMQAYLTAWEGQDPRMHEQVGEERSFEFNPAAVARQRQIEIRLRGQAWPLSRDGAS